MSIFDYLNNIKDPLGLVGNRPLYRENGSPALPGLPYVQLPTQQDDSGGGIDPAALQQQLAYQAEQQRLQDVARQQAEDYAAQQQAQAQAAAQAAEAERQQQAQQAVMNQFTEMMNADKAKERASQVTKNVPLASDGQMLTPASTDSNAPQQDLSQFKTIDSLRGLSPEDLGTVQLMDSGMSQDEAKTYLDNFVNNQVQLTNSQGPLSVSRDDVLKRLTNYNRFNGVGDFDLSSPDSPIAALGRVETANNGEREVNPVASTIQGWANGAERGLSSASNLINSITGTPTATQAGSDLMQGKGTTALALAANTLANLPIGLADIAVKVPELLTSPITGYALDENGNKVAQTSRERAAKSYSEAANLASLYPAIGNAGRAAEGVAPSVLGALKTAGVQGGLMGSMAAGQVALDSSLNNRPATTEDYINAAVPASILGAAIGGASEAAKIGNHGGIDAAKVDDGVDASFLNDKFNHTSYADEMRATPIEPTAEEPIPPREPLPDTSLPNTAEEPIAQPESVPETAPESTRAQETAAVPENAQREAPATKDPAQAVSDVLNAKDNLADGTSDAHRAYADAQDSLSESLKPMADEVVADSEPVKSGSVTADEASSKVVDAWTDAITENPEKYTDNIEQVKKDVPVDSVLKAEKVEPEVKPQAEKTVEKPETNVAKTEEVPEKAVEAPKEEVVEAKPNIEKATESEKPMKTESTTSEKVEKPELISEKPTPKTEKSNLASEKEETEPKEVSSKTNKSDLIEPKPEDNSRNNMVRAAAEVAQESGGHPSESMSSSMFRKKVEEKTGQKLSGSLLNDAKKMYSDKEFNPGEYASRENPIRIENGSVKTDMKTAPVVSAFKLKSGKAEGQLAKWDGNRFTQNGKRTKIETSKPLDSLLKKYKGTTDVYVSKTAKESVVANVDGKPAIVFSSDAAKTDPFKTREDRSRTFANSLDVSDSKRASVISDQLKSVASDPSLAHYRSEAELDFSGEHAVDMEVASYVIRDYADGKPLSSRVESWASKFAMYTKDSLGMQQYTIKEVLDMPSEKLFEEMGKNHINDISRMTDPTFSVSVDKVIHGNPDEVRAAIPDDVRDEVSEHVKITSTRVPNGAVIGEEINVKDIPNSMVEEKVSFDENGRPIPPSGDITGDDFAREAVKDGSPWKEYYDKTLDFVDEQKKTDDFVNQCDDTYNGKPFEPKTYEEMPTVFQFWTNIRDYDAKYNPIVGTIRGLHEAFYQKFADPYAPVTSIQNFTNMKEFKAQKAAWKAKTPDVPKAHRADVLRKASNADVMKCNARDRIQVELRKAGWNKVVDWAAGSAEKQQAIGDYMQGKQVIGAFDVLYDKDSSAFSDLAKEWKIEPDAVRLHAQNMVDRADIPDDMREKIDNCTKYCADYVINTSLETGRITPDVAEKILDLNEQGSYWTMKYDNSKVADIEESLLNANPNTVSDIGGDMVHFKEEQFRLADSHPLTAIYKEMEIITHTCDNLRMNNAIVDYLSKVGLAKEFDINLYEKGSEAMPSFEKSGMASKEAYDDMKKLVDELTKEKKDLRYLETMKDGERKAVAVPADVFEALQDMGVKRLQSGSTVLDGAAGFARMAATVVRAGTTTYYLPRQVWLLTKDLFQIGTQAPVADIKGMITPIWIAKGAKDAFFNRDEMIRKGVLGDYAARVASKDAREEMQNEFKAGDVDISKADVAERHTTAVVEYAINTMEAIGRSTLYEMEYHTAKKWGRSDSEAEMFARTWAAEGLGNFRESGAWMHRLVQFAPYSNSAIQGTRGSLKMAAAQPALTAIRTAAALGTLYMAQSAAVSALGYSKDKWDEVCNALPDSTKYKGIPFPIPGEEPKINTETKKLEGVWMLQMPDDLYSTLNVLNDMNHSSRTFGESVYNNATMALMAFMGIDAVGNNTTDSFYSLMNQWTPIIVKPTMEQLMNRNFYSNTSLLNPDAVDLANQHLITRNSIESYGTSDMDKQVADFITALTGGLVDTNAADVNLFTQSAGTMLSNVADGKNPFDLPVSIIDPYYKTIAVSPINKDNLTKLLYEKWGGYSAGKENEQTFDVDYKNASKLINGILYDGKSPDELRAMVETGEGSGNPNTAAILIAGIGLEAHDEGWNKDDTDKEVAKYYNKSQSELYAMSEEDVKKYFSYIGYAAEKLNSPMLKAEVVLANSERFWNISQDADSRAKMETALREDFNSVDKIRATIDKEMNEGGMDSGTAIRVATKDAAEDVRILFANYENNFDPDTWYKPSAIKDMLKADTAVVSDDDYNAKALKYYETLYSADTICNRDDRDDYSIREKSSGYLKTVAELNSMYGIAKWVQQAYGDAGTGDTSGNITLTEWKDLVKTDPDKAAYLLSYDNARVEAGVSRGSTVDKNKYYISSSKGGYSRGGYGGYGSASSRNWIPSVSDLTNTVYTPKGSTTSTTVSEKKPKVAPITKKPGETFVAGSGTKIKPTTFKAADTVQYTPSKTRQPAMGPAYDAFLNGKSAQSDFKAARQYI